MYNFFKIIFYKLYKVNDRLGFDNVPEWSALCGLCLLISFNLLSLFVIIKYSLGYSSDIDLSKTTILFFLGLLIVLLYQVFISKRKYSKIIEEIKSKGKDSRANSWITITYVLLSIGIFISLIWLK